MDLSTKTVAKIKYIENDFGVHELYNAAWQTVADVLITTYWSGITAPAGRHCSARLLWSETALFVRYIGIQTEPLVASSMPDLSKKTEGLWDRDVFELFIAPDRRVPNRYFEFEAAPTGEWIDVAIESTPEGRISDWGYGSGMRVAATVEIGRVAVAIKIPWKAFGEMPKTGDQWLGNLFRCVGKDPDRGYLAWQPTRTPQPSFHVPSAFGELVFVN
ncbi:MAG: carbohydrate-binding family 9-like protein [Acidobacteriota bacterium]